MLEVLEKYKTPMSRGEIAKELQLDPIHVSHSIARLVKNKDIKIIEINRFQAMERFKCKKRMRLYYT